MIASADATASEVCRLIAELPIPTERDRKAQRLRSITIDAAQDRKGFLWRSGVRMAGSCSVYREADGGLHVLLNSDDPFRFDGSLAGRLQELGFAVPAAWEPGADMSSCCGFAVPTSEPLEATVAAILAALRTIGGGVPANGYELRRCERQRRSQYAVNA